MWQNGILEIEISPEKTLENSENLFSLANAQRHIIVGKRKPMLRMGHSLAAASFTSARLSESRRRQLCWQGGV